MSSPLRLPAVAKLPPLDCNVNAAVPVLIAVAGNVNVPPDTKDTAWFAPELNALTVRLFVSTTDTAPPVSAMLLKSLVPWASVTLPVPAFTVVVPVTVAAAV